MLSVSSHEHHQPTDHLPHSPSLHTTHPRFALKSTNVFLPDNFEPTEAIILVENQKIADIIIPKDTTPEILSQIYSNWPIQDHGNLHIFPGLVDSNVHLHANFNPEWENIAYCTESAAAGGVTTIIDNPIMTKPFTSGPEYIKSMQQRISILKDNCKVDFGVFAALEPRTQDHIAEIMDLGAMGMKCYLLNCMQEGIGHYTSEVFPEILEDLEKYKDLLVMIHPEMATERDLYLTSPCRIGSLEKRLDKKHVIKPLEFGGAANRGSYLDELCKKSTSHKDEDDDDDDCPTATLDTPSKLRGKVKKTMEKNEIDDIVHFELLSYGFGKGPKEEKDEGSSSDSDNEEVGKKKKGKANSLPTCAEVAETSSDNQEEDGQENQSYLSNLPVIKKKSTFSRQNSELRALRPLKENSEADEEDPKKDNVTSNIKDQVSPLIIPNEDNVNEKEEEEGQGVQSEKTETVEEVAPLIVSKTKSLAEASAHHHNPMKLCLRTNNSEANNNKTMHTRKLLSFLTACDVKKSIEKSSTSPQPVIAIEGLNKKDKKEIIQQADNEEIKSTPITTAIIESVPKVASDPTDTNQENHGKSQVDSPALSSRPMTPASSSLLQRRMSRKSSYGIAISASSTLSSPSSDFTKVNSLEVIKSPGSLAKKEAKYNQSYRIFLANRPQNWEENAVSLILAAIPSDTKLRVLLPNLSLASSFLKVRQKKKLNEGLVQRIFSDASPAHLFFNEKMVKKGDTKYKVSPPFRNKENRRLLVENFRLGGIDMVSSYHFYVPPRFKNVDEGNFRRAFGGLDTMGCSLQAVWTAAYSHQQKTNKKFSQDLMYQKKITNHILWQMYRSMCYNPSQMLKIGHRKGAIAKGRDADFVVWDPYKVVDNSDLGPNHVFAGRSLLGTVSQTYLRGNLIFDKDNYDRVSKDYRPEFLRPE